jgi:hypothetical protein
LIAFWSSKIISLSMLISSLVALPFPPPTQ